MRGLLLTCLPAFWRSLAGDRSRAEPRVQSACQTAEESSRGARCPALFADACGRRQTREDYGKAQSAGNAPEPCALEAAMLWSEGDDLMVRLPRARS
jgi:hypothetical protein